MLTFFLVRSLVFDLDRRRSLCLIYWATLFWIIFMYFLDILRTWPSSAKKLPASSTQVSESNYMTLFSRRFVAIPSRAQINLLALTNFIISGSSQPVPLSECQIYVMRWSVSLESSFFSDKYPRLRKAYLVSS